MLKVSVFDTVNLYDVTFSIKMKVTAMKRIVLAKPDTAPYKKLAGMDAEINKLFEAAGLASGYGHLLRLRVSQLNGCAFCVKMHAQDAAKCGENLERIALTSAWEETGVYSDAEKAGFALAEAVTHIQNAALFEQAYEHALTLYTEEQIAAIEWLAIIMNTWNRVGISSQLQA